MADTSSESIWLQNVSLGVGILIMASVSVATVTIISLSIFLHMATSYDGQLLIIPPVCSKRKEVTGFRQEGLEDAPQSFLCQTKVRPKEAEYQIHVTKKMCRKLNFLIIHCSFLLKFLKKRQYKFRTSIYRSIGFRSRIKK